MNELFFTTAATVPLAQSPRRAVIKRNINFWGPVLIESFVSPCKASSRLSRVTLPPSGHFPRLPYRRALRRTRRLGMPRTSFSSGLHCWPGAQNKANTTKF